VVEQAACNAVAEVDDGGGEGEGDDGNKALEGYEDNREQEVEIVGEVETRQERDVESHAGENDQDTAGE